MLQPYVPILILVVFVIANAVLMLGVSHLLSTYRRTPVKIAPYESGMPVLCVVPPRGRAPGQDKGAGRRIGH